MKSILPNANKLGDFIKEKMTNGYHIDFHFSINEHGHHSKMYWREEFPKAVSWLLFEV
ncbi:hypothetical protein [Psychroserpens damuponensis]|uniref:hypothetical protein n=1 Tax=Psychroserpens damuponensis TaxID=943936 RepID=UPI000AA55E17|nr:hypothetical protein [Psychroserpens damuponensis]